MRQAIKKSKGVFPTQDCLRYKAIKEGVERYEVGQCIELIRWMMQGKILMHNFAISDVMSPVLNGKNPTF